MAVLLSPEQDIVYVTPRHRRVMILSNIEINGIQGRSNHVV